MSFLIFHPTIAEQMGRQAERRFKELFSAEKMCAEYARVYGEVLQAHKSKPSTSK
jgi:glycosyltransferase involved in cell wall biosynthesis